VVSFASGETYLSLARNDGNPEWFEDADACYYHYRRASQAAKSFAIREGEIRKINWSKLLDGLAWICRQNEELTFLDNLYFSAHGLHCQDSGQVVPSVSLGRTMIR